MELIAVFRLTKKKSIIYNTTAGVVFTAGFLAFLYFAAVEKSGILANYIIESHNSIIMFVFTGIVILLHELFHVAGYKLFGGKVKCGVKLLNIYTMDISGNYYSTAQMIVIMLLPAVLLSLLLIIPSILLPQFIYYFFIGLLFNISGSSGDIFMSWFLIKQGWNCKVKDNDDGFDIYSDRKLSAQDGLTDSPVIIKNIS